MSEPTDGELVQRTRGGDREAYSALVARYQGHVYGLAYSLVGDWAEAQDIAQEAFLRAYLNLDQLRDPSRFAAWLRRVAFSVAMNWVKTFRPEFFRQLDGRVDLDTLEIPDFAPGPPEVVQRRELAEAVQRAVASLPPRYRIPLTMFHLDGLSYQKVADFLDIPLGTAKSLISRARQKLREGLAAYAAEEVSPMVQEVFNEHKLPAEFARKVLDNVPALAWGTQRECTFLGALEAAVAGTDHPYSYTDLMGWSGMAFRARWFSRDDKPGWCPSCAVAEMKEEIDAVQQATGWPLRVEFMDGADAARVERLTGEVTTNINAGRAVLGYDAKLNMGVVYGYEEGGQTILLRDYDHGAEPARLPPAKLGFQMLFLGEHREPVSRREALVLALNMAVRNWERERFRVVEGPAEYWYGRVALDRWAQDIAGADRLADKDQRTLCGVGWWAFITMRDARRAAVTFLRENASLLDGAAARQLEVAAALYEREEALMGPAHDRAEAFPEDGSTWSPAMRAREVEILHGVRDLDAQAIAAIKQALASIATGP